MFFQSFFIEEVLSVGVTIYRIEIGSTDGTISTDKYFFYNPCIYISYTPIFYIFFVFFDIGSQSYELVSDIFNPLCIALCIAICLQCQEYVGVGTSG